MNPKSLSYKESLCPKDIYFSLNSLKVMNIVILYHIKRSKINKFNLGNTFSMY